MALEIQILAELLRVIESLQFPIDTWISTAIHIYMSYKQTLITCTDSLHLNTYLRYLVCLRYSIKCK